MKCYCRECEGTGKVECDECGGTGERDFSIGMLNVPPTHKHIIELRLLQKDVSMAKCAAMALASMRPEYKDSYEKQMQETIRIIEEKAYKLIDEDIS